MALAASPAGNCTTKALVLVVLSAPKSNTAIAGLVPPALYIKAPRAVIEDDAHVVSAKSRKATVPEPPFVGLVEIVNVFPPAT